MTLCIPRVHGLPLAVFSYSSPDGDCEPQICHDRFDSLRCNEVAGMNAALNRPGSMAAAIQSLCGSASALNNAGTKAGGHAVCPLTSTVPSGRLIDKIYFGQRLHHGDTTTHWPPAAFGYFHLWDSDTDWASLQPVPGKWDFVRLVTLSAAHGAEVVLMGNTLGWASARLDEVGNCGTGCAAEPAQIADWNDYGRAVSLARHSRLMISHAPINFGLAPMLLKTDSMPW